MLPSRLLVSIFFKKYRFTHIYSGALRKHGRNQNGTRLTYERLINVPIFSQLAYLMIGSGKFALFSFKTFCLITYDLDNE